MIHILGWLLLLGIPTFIGSLEEESEVKVYPSPKGLLASPHYEVQVEDQGKWKSSFVYFDPARTDGSGARDEAGKSFSWTTVESNQPLKVRVRRLNGAFESVILRPNRYKIKPKVISPDVIQLIAKPGQKISVEFSDEVKQSCYTGPPYGIPCLKNSMLVFIDKLKTKSAIDLFDANDIYTVKPGSHEELLEIRGLPGNRAGKSKLGDCDGKKVVHFPPGVYDIGYWQVPNNIEHVHIEGGAIVYGALDVIPRGRHPFYDSATIDHVYRDDWQGETLRKRFSLTGSGIISGAKLPWHLKKDFTYTSNDDWWAHVKLIQLAVERVRVEDVTIANSPYWVLSFINDADQRTRGTFENFKMVGAWTYNNDGLPNASGQESYIKDAFIHADDDAFKLYNSGSTIENCVVWQSNNGAVFQLGWFPKTVSKVRVRNIDVIHFENWYGVGHSNRAVFNYASSGGKGKISDIEFNDINIEGPVLRLFGFHCHGSQKIKDITFRNLNVPGGMGVGNLGSPGANYFIGAITDFKFNNFIFGDQRVDTAKQAQFEFKNGAGDGFIFR